MTKKLFALAAVASALFATTASVEAGPVYMRSTVGAPWGQTTNEAAMDLTFGAGNWADLRYETSAAATVFNATNRYVFMEGGDNNANELEAYLTTNLAAIEAWVTGGGSLFLNSAPNEGNGMSYGFGGVNLVYTDFTVDPVTAVNAAHPIFNGPNATTTSFTGGFYGHGSITGPGLTDLLEDATAAIYLAEKAWGLGHVMFGGMTTTNFHSPQPQAFNLRANILDYGAAQADQQQAIVPEPGTLALLACGGLGLVGGAIRRRRMGKAVV